MTATPESAGSAHGAWLDTLGDGARVKIRLGICPLDGIEFAVDGGGDCDHEADTYRAFLWELTRDVDCRSCRDSVMPGEHCPDCGRYRSE